MSAERKVYLMRQDKAVFDVNDSVAEDISWPFFLGKYVLHQIEDSRMTIHRYGAVYEVYPVAVNGNLVDADGNPKFRATRRLGPVKSLH